MLLSTAFFTLACVAALEADVEKAMQSTRAIHARASICFYFTANGPPTPAFDYRVFRLSFLGPP